MILSVSTVYKRFKNTEWSVEDRQVRDQISKPKKYERVATTEESFCESRASSLKVLSAETGIAHAMCYRISIQTLKMQKLRTIPRYLLSGQLKMCKMYSMCDLRNLNQRKTRLEHVVAINDAYFNIYRQSGSGRRNVVGTICNGHQGQRLLWGIGQNWNNECGSLPWVPLGTHGPLARNSKARSLATWWQLQASSPRLSWFLDWIKSILTIGYNSPTLSM